MTAFTMDHATDGGWVGIIHRNVDDDDDDGKKEIRLYNQRPGD